ncbi:MAG: helix-turn-helix transcriptional regulator [Clostridia bacterium]|nr:helix-turn-helix transcriptional regulator [Clostridia bacterium]
MNAMIEMNMPFRYEYWRDKSDKLAIGRRLIEKVTEPVYHVHRALEVIYVDEGHAEVLIGDRITPMEAGSFAVISPLIPHTFYHGVSASWLLLIPATMVRSATNELDGMTFAHPVMCDNGALLSCIKIIHAIYTRTGIYQSIDDAHREELLTSASSLLLQTTISVCGLTEQRSGDHLLLRAVAYLDAHFREDIRVPAMARALLCSQAELSAGFRSAFGMSISEYLGRLRAVEVRRLLAENPDMTLPEAAARSGFGSLRSLHRVYLKEFGTTPRQE